MGAPEAIRQLIETFDRNIETYKTGCYNETQIRREFLDPFFEALGWDVANKKGYAQAYKEVIHEEAIKVGTATKAPDYSFRIGGARKFFVEAKKPSVDIKDDAHPAYQLRRYAWSAKLPLSILTDFEELAVYDCQSRPKASDKADAGRIMFINYRDYIDRWDEIANIFSPEAINKGSFDKFITATKGKRGTSTVDIEFLNEIEEWRKLLAKYIARDNKALSREGINFAVQRTIDRILFLRMCEDRAIENYGQLQMLIGGDRIYPRLCEVFERADEKYNSGLFHFRPEKDRAETPDELTLNLKIDDMPLRWILGSIYYPKSPYEFSMLSAEVLGNVYEQFLGRVITLSQAHTIKIEEKPEVKKAGGVYYTPSYIVDYIVKNTVGKLCENKTPKEIAKLRILDPACGSGSFLLGAYTYLLDYHRDWYVENDPAKYTRQIYQGKGGQWLLTIAEKKKILLNNIYGVDIDSQAVEVTKLSLLLKVLEGENLETLKLIHERALPDLGNNIKCGNSLIGPDFYDDSSVIASAARQSSSFDSDELRNRINAFDWQKEFPSVFKQARHGEVGRSQSGFDAVIGNPPYIRIQTMQETQPEAILYFNEKYCAASKGNYDIYVVFVEKGLSLLNKNGRLGFILPHKFFNAQYGAPLRKLLAEGKNLSHIVHFGHQQVFEGATTYTCLLFLSKTPTDKCEVAQIDNLTNWVASGKSSVAYVPAKNISQSEWNFVVGNNYALFRKLKETPTKLADIAHIFVGTQTSAGSIFVLEDCHFEKKYLIGTSKVTDKKVRIEAKAVKPFLKGKNIRKYENLKTTSYLVCPYVITKDSFELMPEEELSAKYPLAYAYLKSQRVALAARERGKFKGNSWFAFGYPKSMTLFQRPKIVVPDYNNVPSFTFDSSGHFYKTGYGIILQEDVKESPYYILGLLNTKLLFQYLRQVSTTLRGGYIRFWTQFTELLPIRRIDFKNQKDKAKHDKMVSLVERMLELHKKLNAAKVPDEKTKLQRQIDATDAQIDKLVYELYGLTEEEIKIVEGAI